MDNQQRNLSEQLQLLRELHYCNTRYPANNRRNRQSRDPDANREVRLLDTFAVALSTGNPGEVFAASFDKRVKIQLVLAKNGPPTPDDIAAATELISLIGDPAVTLAGDLLPFLIRRCGPNINKRIRNVHTSLKELQNDFMSALEEGYEPADDMTAEFPHAAGRALIERYGDSLPPFATLWGHFVDKLTDITTDGIKPEDYSFSSSKYADIYIHAETLGRSRFLKTLVEDHEKLDRDRKGRAVKLKHRLDKVRQYTNGVSKLVRHGKRLFPIPHRWVMDTFSPGTGEGVFDLSDTAYNAMLRILDHPSQVSPRYLEILDTRFPSMLSNWQSQRTMNTCIHAELRIILHLGGPSGSESIIHPIGLSKRSCLCCTLWIAAHNRIFRTEWMTSACDGKPFGDWALPGSACSYAVHDNGTSSVDEAVVHAISEQLTDALGMVFPRKRVYNEFYDEVEFVGWDL